MNKINFHSYFVLCFSLVLLWACGDDGETTVADQATIDEELILAYLEENDLLDVTERDESGIYYQISSENPSGDMPASGDVLSVYFRAAAMGQQAFDAVTNDGSTASAKLQYNTSSVYPIGLDQALGLLREKESGIFYIPSELAFGDMEGLSSIIPPNSVLVVELVLDMIQTEAEVHTEELSTINNYVALNRLNDTDYYPLDPVELLEEDVYYKRLVAGTENDTLLNGDQADIRYLFYALSTYPNGTPIDGTASNEALSFSYEPDVVIPGIYTVLAEMERSEKALLLLPSARAYGASAFVIPRNRKEFLVDQNVIPLYASKVTPYQILAVEIELLEPQPALD